MTCWPRASTSSIWVSTGCGTCRVRSGCSRCARRGCVGEFAALSSVDAFPGNLPLQVSSFIGREREIDRSVAALERRAGRDVDGGGWGRQDPSCVAGRGRGAARFREGAWLVELAPVRDPDDVVDAFAAVFGVTARAGQTLEEALVEFLRTKQLLLVVDNCEHVLDAVADLVEEISAHVSAGGGAGDEPGGSGARRRADVRGAVVGGPDADAETWRRSAASDAVQLFVERAAAADADFVLDCCERGRRWCRCVAVSTGCRWRSSWPRRG